jgi:hypothetical protein
MSNTLKSAFARMTNAGCACGPACRCGDACRCKTEAPAACPCAK